MHTALRLVTTAAIVFGFFGDTAGAQGELEGTTPSVVVCQSQPGERQHCEADTSGGVALAGQVGPEACLLGKSWGYDDTGIWVADGCGGRFVLGQAEPSPDTKDGILRKFNPYGRFLGHIAYFDDEVEIQDNASWLGLKFATGEKVKFIAHAEFGVNIIGGEDRFRAGTRTDSGLLTIEELEDPPVFGNRLGYLGVDFGAAGRVAIGKDWGVHYDIASYTTDRWNAFGGQASLAYPGGGDGGISGTGRANQVLNYRVTVARIVEIGLQTQFANSRNNDAFDGFGGSVQVTVLPGLTVGGAYTRIDLEEITDLVLGADGDGEYGIVGVNFSSKLVDIGAVYATQKNGDMRTFLGPDPGGDPLRIPVVFDGNGVEIYARVKLGRWGINGGFIDYNPDTDGTPLDPDFRDRYFILGADWAFAEGAWAYTEFRIDDSVGFEGGDGVDVGVLGIKYQFSWNTFHNP